MSITATSTFFNLLSPLYTHHTFSPNLAHCSVFTSPLRYNGARLLGFAPHAISSQDHGVFDSELHSVLQLATGSELYEVERILFGTSYFSPLLKSIAKPSNIDYVMIEEDPDEREEFISILESRFFFLAADARSSLRGWRPTYRDVLLGVRKELKIHCSTKLSTEDLEVEIFLHLLQEYSSFIPRKEADWTNKNISSITGALRRGYDSRDTIVPIILDDTNVQDPHEWLIGVLEDEEDDLVHEGEDLSWTTAVEAMGVNEPSYATRTTNGRGGSGTSTSAPGRRRGSVEASISRRRGRQLVDEDDFDFGEESEEEHDAAGYKDCVSESESGEDEPQYEDLDDESE